jgi:hypothetical protein
MKKKETKKKQIETHAPIELGETERGTLAFGSASWRRDRETKIGTPVLAVSRRVRDGERGKSMSGLFERVRMREERFCFDQEGEGREDIGRAVNARFFGVFTFRFVRNATQRNKIYLR